LRISAGGGTNAVVKSYIDLSGFSTVPDMDKNIVFGTSGTEKMRINSLGDVGIGTTNPLGPLEVYKGNSGGLGGYIVINNNGLAVANSTALMFGDGGGGSVRAAISTTTENSPYYGQMDFKTGAGTYASLTTQMTIKGNGNVGIGTTNPITKLHVAINDNTFAGAALLENTNTGTSALSTISFKTANNASTFTVGQVNNGGSAIIYNGANTDMNFSTNASTRMTITAGGDVGIGTTSPSNLLHIAQSNFNFIRVQALGTPISYSTYFGTSGPNSVIYNDNGMDFYLDSTQDIILRPNSGSELIRLVGSTALVGIGTSSPTVKLDTVGYVKDTKYIVNEQEPFTLTVNYSGDVIEGNIHGSVSQWDLVSLDPNGTWYRADDATISSTYLLGIYLGNISGDLILLEGHITVNDNVGGSPDIQGLATGIPIYIRDGGVGDMSTTLPTTTGNYVRICGHAYYKSGGASDTYIMKFRPSNDWIQL
jgi:hypothetical protein